jgi:hypothetical protein
MAEPAPAPNRISRSNACYVASYVPIVEDALAVPGSPILSLAAEDRSAGGIRDRTGPEPRSVRAGSIAAGQTMDNGGHEWSPNIHRSRRSRSLDLSGPRQSREMPVSSD